VLTTTISTAADLGSQVINALGPSWLNPDSLLKQAGGWAFAIVVAIIFAECGLLIGFFLPGDSLLFITGLFIASGAIAVPLPLACLILTVAAVAGNLVGYWIGYRAGPTLFNKPESRFFKAEYVEHTHNFFEKYGRRAIVLARFVPIVRTFITATAGIGRMDFRVYATYSAIGGVLWATVLTILGYAFGGVPFIKNNIEIITILIVALSVVPIAIELHRNRRNPSPAVDPTASVEPVSDPPASD